MGHGAHGDEEEEDVAEGNREGVGVEATGGNFGSIKTGAGAEAFRSTYHDGSSEDGAGSSHESSSSGGRDPCSIG